MTDGQAHTVKPNFQIGFSDNRFGNIPPIWCLSVLQLLLNKSIRITLQRLGSRRRHTNVFSVIMGIYLCWIRHVMTMIHDR